MENHFLPRVATSSKRTRKDSGSKSTSQKKSPPSKTTDTTAVTGTKGPPQKTPLRKHTETAASLASKCSSSTPRNSRKVVDKTPKGRNSNNGTPMSPHNGLNGSPEATQKIMATLKEISNTLSQVVNRMDKQESRMECMEKKISQRSTPSSSSSASECTKVKVPPIVRVSVLLDTIMCMLFYKLVVFVV